MFSQVRRGWVGLAVGVMLAAVFFLLPGMQKGFARNQTALALQHDAKVILNPWQAYCAARDADLQPVESGCRDAGECYLARTRAGLSGDWDSILAQPFQVNNESDVFQRGYAQWCKGNAAAALETWKPHAQVFADYFDLLGLEAFAQKQYMLSADWSRLSLAVVPSAKAAFHLGRVYAANGEAEKAFGIFLDLTKNYPEQAEYFFSAANAAARLGDARAIPLMEQGLKLAPKDWLNWHVYGNMLGDRAEWAQAETAYAQSVALNPTWIHNNAGLGFALARQGKLAAARRYFDVVAQSAGPAEQIAGYEYAFASIADEQGDTVLAVEYYMRAAQTTPGNSFFVGVLLKEYVKRGDCAGMTHALAQLEPLMRPHNLQVQPPPCP